MMIRCLIFSLLGLFLVYKTQADTQCNLRAIFKTPKRSNYDEFELMERSNFLNDDVSPKNQPAESKVPNTFSNARVLLKLGDYRNAVRKNNNNVNTKITLAGPNHNNYYQPPFVQPYYPPMSPPVGYYWNPYYQSPRVPQYAPQYYVVSPPRYQTHPYPVPPPHVPIINIPPQNPLHKPKFVINDPIVLDNSVIQHIPIASIHPKSSVSNGLNTMTVIPKILIDTVAKQPTIVEKIGTEKSADPAIPPFENITNFEYSPEEPKLENVEQPQEPEVQNLKIEEFKPTPQNLTENRDSVVAEASPDIIQNIPKESANQGNYQIVELSPVGSAEPSANDNFIVPDVNNSFNNPAENKKEPNVLAEQEIPLSESVPELTAETIQPKTPPEVSPIHNMDHPRVLHPVKLSNNIENVEIVGAGNVNISLNGNSVPVIENCKNDKDFELVDLLKKSLVPFINLKTNEEPKLLVSYPVINNFDKHIPAHPSAIIVESLKREPTFCAACTSGGSSKKKDKDIDHLNIFKFAPMIPQAYPDVQESSSGYSVSSSSSSSAFSSSDGSPKTVVSGYQISSGSGYYEDPTKKIVYKKPTEITVVPPQLTDDIPSFMEPAFIPHRSSFSYDQHEDIPMSLDRYIQPRPQPQVMSRSKLLDLLKYLLEDVSSTPLVHTRPAICPYCTNMIRLPTVVRCPHCLNYHDVSRSHSSPEMYRSFCSQCTASRPTVQPYWSQQRVLQKSPYCAKYIGELNQLS